MTVVITAVLGKENTTHPQLRASGQLCLMQDGQGLHGNEHEEQPGFPRNSKEGPAQREYNQPRSGTDLSH